MEIHSVLPEERARTEQGETLPWGYRYADSAKNARQVEESGPFGRNRSLRYTSSAGRRASTRQGTTPSRSKENSAVADFSRLFAKEQAARSEGALPAPTDTTDALPPVPTECLLYGYASKQSEWKVISRYERIVTPSIICEDYPREDPNLYMSSNSPMGFNRSSIVVHKNLSKEALSKSRNYRGGNHWIKVTFDSYEAAERACFYSPVEIDGYTVYCEMFSGRGPISDAPIPRGVDGELVSVQQGKARTMGGATAAAATGRASAVKAFEQVMGGTLPRSHTLPDMQFMKPASMDDMDMDRASSSTATSATATSPPPAASSAVEKQQSALRSRSVPQLPSQVSTSPTSQYMSRAPGIKKAVLRPISEALPPKQSGLERLLRALPIVSWVLFSAPTTKDEKGLEKGGLIGDGPLVKEDGTWDDGNGWYWSLWHVIDTVAGTDFCGLKDD